MPYPQWPWSNNYLVNLNWLLDKFKSHETLLTDLSAEGNVRYDEIQALTNDQKRIARNNIGATAGSAAGALVLTNEQFISMSKELLSNSWLQGFRLILVENSNTKSLLSLASTGETSFLASNMSPENLLDNPAFTIWQRGRIQFNTTQYKEYSADRWCTTASTTITPVDRGIQITSPAGSQLRQYLENYDQMRNRSYTLAVKLSAPLNTSFSLSAIPKIDNSQQLGYQQFTSSTNDPSIYSTSFLVPSDNDCLAVCIGNFTANSTFHIEWVSLVEGEYSSNCLPPVDLRSDNVELERCLYFFERIGRPYEPIIALTTAAASSSYSTFPLYYSRKRAEPSVIASPPSAYRIVLVNQTSGSSSAIGITQLSINNKSPVMCSIETYHPVIPEASIALLHRADGSTVSYFDVSADL